MAAAKAKASRVQLLIDRHTAIVAEIKAENAKANEIEHANDEALYREARILMSRLNNQIGWGADKKPNDALYAYSHDDIDQQRNSIKQTLSVFGPDKTRSAEFEAKTRQMHAHFDLDKDVQDRFRKAIGLTAVEEKIAALYNEEDAIIARVLAIRPKTVAELQAKAACLVKFVSDETIGSPESALSALAGDVARLGRAPTEARGRARP